MAKEHHCENNERRSDKFWICTFWINDDGLEINDVHYKVSEHAVSLSVLRKALSAWPHRGQVEIAGWTRDNYIPEEEAGTLHAQVFIGIERDKGPIKRDAIINSVKWYSENGEAHHPAHVESVCRSCPGQSLAKAFNYCIKEEKRVENYVFGDYQMSGRNGKTGGKKYDDETIQKMLEAGVPPHEVIRNNPGSYRQAKSMVYYWKILKLNDPKFKAKKSFDDPDERF